MEDMIANIMESIPGFKFHPSDDELLLLYLKPKIEGTQVDRPCVVPDVEVCKKDPWLLSKLLNELSVWKSQEGAREWIFFCPRKRKYLNGQRFERTTPSGYWKVTGIDRTVKSEDGVSIGTKKTVVFYTRHFPKGKRTNWVMHEYHLNASCLSDASYGDQLPYVVCRLKLKKDKKGVTTLDYPTEGSNNNSPYTSDGADHTQVNSSDSSLYNTPNTATPEYHQETGHPNAAAYQSENSLDDVFDSLPDIQQLDVGATSERNVHDGSSAFNHGYWAPLPLSPWNTYKDNSGFSWGYSSGSYN